MVRARLLADRLGELTGTRSIPTLRRRRKEAAIGNRQHDERGAVLILALIFLVAAGGIVTALLAWGGSDIKNVAQFQQNRTLNYAAGSAMQVQMQAVRYNSNACTSSPPSSVPIPNGPNPSNTVTIDVWCTLTTFAQTSATTRVVTLTACSTTQLAQMCSQSNPYLTVVVAFGDYSSTNRFSSSTPCTSTSPSCGVTMTIKSWTFK